MYSFREPNILPTSDSRISLPIPADLAVSVVSVPFLLLLMSRQATLNRLIQLGGESEEIFRGERLPSLPLLSTDS